MKLLNRSSTSILPLVIILIGVILLLGAGAWYMSGGDLFHLTATPEPVVITEDTYANIPRVSVKDAKAALESSSAVFVDVRAAQTYQQSHIQGALSIPFDELPSRTNELSPSDWIITYCT
jgi:3-mercaptopyruvate sulfurtransferase SseA